MDEPSDEDSDVELISFKPASGAGAPAAKPVPFDRLIRIHTKRQAAAAVVTSFLNTFSTSVKQGASSAEMQEFINANWPKLFSSSAFLWQFLARTTAGLPEGGHINCDKDHAPSPAMLVSAASTGATWSAIQPPAAPVSRKRASKRSAVEELEEESSGDEDDRRVTLVKEPSEKRPFPGAPLSDAPDGVAYTIPAVSKKFVSMRVNGRPITAPANTQTTAQRIVAMNWARATDGRPFSDDAAVKAFTSILSKVPFPHTYDRVCAALGAGFWSDSIIFSDDPTEVSRRSYEAAIRNMSAAVHTLYGPIPFTKELQYFIDEIPTVVPFKKSECAIVGVGDDEVDRAIGGLLFMRLNNACTQYFRDYANALTTHWRDHIHDYTATWEDDPVAFVNYSQAGSRVPEPKLTSYVDSTVSLLHGLAYTPQLDPLPLGQLAAASPVQLAASRALQARREAAAGTVRFSATGGPAGYPNNYAGVSAGGGPSKRSIKKQKANTGGNNNNNGAPVLAGSNRGGQTVVDSTPIILAPGATDLPVELRHLKHKRMKPADILNADRRVKNLRTADGREVCINTWFNGVGTCKNTWCHSHRSHEFPAPGAVGGSGAGGAAAVVMPTSTGSLPTAPAAL